MTLFDFTLHIHSLYAFCLKQLPNIPLPKLLDGDSARTDDKLANSGNSAFFKQQIYAPPPNFPHFPDIQNIGN